jgi:hypothetical protein
MIYLLERARKNSRETGERCAFECFGTIGVMITLMCKNGKRHLQQAESSAIRFLKKPKFK